ncbi:MAG: nucleotidyltransferase domain-containing protein [Betaproteobacteria bacterium]|nr:nucleotidyltransferase domain-containing protein [Betaproteobacteria bacterium]
MKTLAQLSLDDRDRAAIAEAVRLLRSRFPIERVMLYGSKVRGTDDKESDIDLLVLTSRVLGWKERDAITDALFDIELAHGVVISSLILPAAEWERGRFSVLPIHEEIEDSGVLI